MAVIAHQGGWDEILLIVGPMVLVVGLLRLARRRADTDTASPPPSRTPSPPRSDG